MSPDTAQLLEQCHEIQRWSAELRKCARECVKRSNELQEELCQAQVDTGNLGLLTRRVSQRVCDSNRSRG